MPAKTCHLQVQKIFAYPTTWIVDMHDASCTPFQVKAKMITINMSTLQVQTFKNENTNKHLYIKHWNSYC